MSGGTRIGLDLDNTLISYEEVFRTYAQRRGLIEAGFRGGKDEVRQALRRQDDGELKWQQLQGAVYGKGVAEAALFDGADAFLRRASALGREIVIVSHKTEFGHYDPDRINLREAALAWMRAQGFFDPDGLGVAPDKVRFTATRGEKLALIRELAVDFFIDDLPEVLEHPEFPPEVTGILFTRGATSESTYPRIAAHWRDIARMVLG
ncbi:MAG: hypothetical protein WAV02_13415 [Stellaceae bacterium]